MPILKKCICGGSHRKKSVARACFKRADKKKQKACKVCGILHRTKKAARKCEKKLLAKSAKFTRSDFGI